MPHIEIVVSTGLRKSIPWNETILSIHEELASAGHAAMADLKSRVKVCEFALSGTDLQAEQVVATLTMTNPRPEETMAAMASIVFEHLQKAVKERADGRWAQCCVFNQFIPKSRYQKASFNEPGKLEGWKGNQDSLV